MTISVREFIMAADPWELPRWLYPLAVRAPGPFGGDGIVRIRWRRIPLLPVVVYLWAGDRVLFWLWWQTRRPVYWLADGLGLDPIVVAERRERGLPPGRWDEPIWRAAGGMSHEERAAVNRRRVNAELARRDALGIAPDGGTFDAS